MPRPMSLAFSTRPSSRREAEEDSLASVPLSRTPTMKKAKARLSRLLHRKSFELQEYAQMYDFKGASNSSNKRKITSLHRQTISQPIGGGTQDIHWHKLQQQQQSGGTQEYGPHKLSMVSERTEPLTPLSPRLPRPGSRSSKRVLEAHHHHSASTSADLNRAPLELYGYGYVRPEYRPDSAKSSILTKTIASTSKHDSMLTDYSELCAMPFNEEDVVGDELREIHELPSSTSTTTRFRRTPSCSAPIPCWIATEDGEQEDPETRTVASSSASSHYSASSSSAPSDDHDVEETPVSPMAPRSPPALPPSSPPAAETADIPQVTALDVQNMPDFSFVPNAIEVRHRNTKDILSARHLSTTNASFVATFPDCDNVVTTDWQVECYRLRKQLKAVELQLRYKAELLSSEQQRSLQFEQENARTKKELQLCRGETQLLRVSNGLKHAECEALKAELGGLKGRRDDAQSRNKDLYSQKLKVMAERLQLEEDAVADKDLRIKWLEKEREELERENRVLENVKGALWGHIEQARKREGSTPVASPALSGDGQPSWMI